MSIIYKTTNLVNGKIYVGQHNTSANDGYLGSGLILNNAISKYGKEKFIRETLEYCTYDNVNEREIYWIQYLSANNRNIGYNIANGGNSIGKHSEETILKMKESKMGEKNGMFGIHHSKEVKQKISESNSGENNYWFGKKLSNTHIENLQKNRGDYSGEKSWNFGKKLSEKTKQKISKSHDGKKLSQNHKNKLSELNKGNKHPQNKFEYILENGENFWTFFKKNERKSIMCIFSVKKIKIIYYKGWKISRQLITP